MNLLNMMVTTATTSATPDPAAIDPTMNLMMLGFFAVAAVAMWFFLIRPQKKREKEMKAQIDKMVVGDSVVTIGGVVGTIANIREDEVTLTTSVAHSMITFKKSAISTVVPRQQS